MTMFGPAILARTLSTLGPETKHGIRWQYHSRSDRHSKVASWGVAFDLLASSAVLRQHAEDGKIILGVNHTMSDYIAHRKKDLDLVIARPGEEPTDAEGLTLASLVDTYGIELTPQEQDVLDGLPTLRVAPVGSVLIAMEAKAAMTAHVKALPRLYDELSSSHACVHGENEPALAIAYVQVNMAEKFISSNPKNVDLIARGLDPEISQHRQPSDTERVLDKLRSLRVRTDADGVGFDAIGVTVLEMVNDGTPATVVSRKPAPQRGDSFHYASMVMRMATRYDTQFRHI